MVRKSPVVPLMHSDKVIEISKAHWNMEYEPFIGVYEPANGVQGIASGVLEVSREV